MSARPVELSPGDWAVLGAVGEGPTHGFAVAALLAPDGVLGRVWTLPRPMVYQSLKKLLAAHLVREQATVRTARGPARTVVAITAGGRRALERWLRTPVEHVRDLRSLLLLKLALLDRAGQESRTLLEAQRAQLRPQRAALEQQCAATEGFERVLALWRLASSRAAEEFIDTVLSDRDGTAAASAATEATDGRVGL